MNVAHFASAYYPSVGGVQERLRQLARLQCLAGDHPLIVTNRWPKQLSAAEIYEGVPVRRFVFRVPEPNWRQFPGALICGPWTLARIIHELRLHRIQMIHIQCVSSNAYYALQAARRLQLPVVATLQGELTMDESGVFQRSRFARRLLRTVMRTADAISACSATTLQEAEGFYGEPLGDRGQVIYNGVVAGDFVGVEPYSHPRPYLLAIGRHVRQKGFDLLLAAFAKVVQAKAGTHDLLIAGDGAERKNLERLAVELGLGGRVHFVGVTDRLTTARLFVGCSFFVLPSRVEPFGIVNIEAMAAGKAVLANAVGGVPEIVQNGRTGILIEAGDIEALAGGITRLILNPDLCRTLGTAGLERVPRFNWNSVANQYNCIYQAIEHQRRNFPAQSDVVYG